MLAFDIIKTVVVLLLRSCSVIWNVVLRCSLKIDHLWLKRKNGNGGDGRDDKRRISNVIRPKTTRKWFCFGWTIIFYIIKSRPLLRYSERIHNGIKKRTVFTAPGTDGTGRDFHVIIIKYNMPVTYCTDKYSGVPRDDEKDRPQFSLNVVFIIILY